MKRLGLFFLLISAVILSAQPRSIVLLHTNDMHATFQERPAPWVRTEPRPVLGGFKELYAITDSIRRTLPGKTLLIDIGDVMTGNPISDYVHKGAVGGALFAMMNKIGYDAWTYGNHDLDISQENLARLTAIARFPTLCANVVNADGKIPFNALRSLVLTVNGVRIGLFGLMSEDLFGLVMKTNTAGLTVLPVAETAQQMVNELDAVTDVIVAMTHQGFREDSLLATRVKGLDVIVGGHSHTRLRTPMVVNDIIIAQAGSNTENLGILELSVENDRIVSHAGRLHQLWKVSGRLENPFTRFADSLSNELDKAFSEQVAVLKSPWVRGGGGETGIGNFVSDAQLEASKADASFMNTRGIRADIPAGPLTKMHIYQVMPFRNTLVTFQMTGKELQNAVRYVLEKQTAVQTGGMKIEYTLKGDSIHFTSFLIGGKPLKPQKLYTVVVSDYFAGESDSYLGYTPKDVKYLGTTLYSAIEAKARRHGEIDSQVEGRIRKIE